MRGKDKCRILKQIRAQIAAENDIDLVIEECTHKGECRGTCPRCESEVRYLEAELEKRRKLAKGVALAGISAGMTLALSGCSVVDAVTDLINPQNQLDGMIGSNDPQIFELAGDVPYPPEIEEGEVELEGDVLAEPDDGTEGFGAGDSEVYGEVGPADGDFLEGF